MAHDPAVYPDPFNFKPERFFNAEGKLDYAAIDPVKYSFGFGRRYDSSTRSKTCSLTPKHFQTLRWISLR